MVPNYEIFFCRVHCSSCVAIGIVGKQCSDEPLFGLRRKECLPIVYDISEFVVRVVIFNKDVHIFKRSKDNLDLFLNCERLDGTFLSALRVLFHGYRHKVYLIVVNILQREHAKRLIFQAQNNDLIVLGQYRRFHEGAVVFLLPIICSVILGWIIIFVVFAVSAYTLVKYFESIIQVLFSDALFLSVFQEPFCFVQPV